MFTFSHPVSIRAYLRFIPVVLTMFIVVTFVGTTKILFPTRTSLLGLPECRVSEYCIYLSQSKFLVQHSCSCLSVVYGKADTYDTHFQNRYYKTQAFCSSYIIINTWFINSVVMNVTFTEDIQNLIYCNCPCSWVRCCKHDETDDLQLLS
jgi:hypothetical protein